MNLGNDEIFECYIGSEAISEAYLGEDLVFSSGPFVGMKMTPKTMKFMDKAINTGDTFNLSVKSSEDWTLTTDADWFTLSPTTGLGTGNKEVITLTVTSIPSAETTNTITCTSANYSASTSTLLKIGYGIPANEIWYATSNGNRITTLNQWKVFNKSGQNISSQCDFSTYGKFVFNEDIGYVKDSPYSIGNGWQYLTELGLPEMEPSLCLGTDYFGLNYVAGNMSFWTRVYGDYEYINDDETMAWSSDGVLGVCVRGKSGTLVIPEGVVATIPYVSNKAQWTAIEFPTSFTGLTGFQDGKTLGQYAFEDCTSLSSIKYKTPAKPNLYSNAFNRVTGSGNAYYPCGGTGYSGDGKPSNFTWTEYGC